MAETRDIANRIGYSGDLSDLEKGIEVEREHGPDGPNGGKFDVTHGNTDDVAASIAAAHLSESNEYYRELDKMEKKLEKDAQFRASEKLASISENISALLLGTPYGNGTTQDREMVYRTIGLIPGAAMGASLGKIPGGILGALLGSRIGGLGFTIQDAMDRTMGKVIPRKEAYFND